MPKEYDVQAVEQKIDRLTKKLDELRDALTIAQQKSDEVSWAQKLCALTLQVEQINEKLQKRKKWGLIPQILIPIFVIIWSIVTIDVSIIALIAIDTFTIIMLEVIMDSILTTVSWYDIGILMREKEAKSRVPDALKKKSPSQLQAIEKRYDTECTRIREQIKEYEALINNIETYLTSVYDYEELLEKIETLENPPYSQMLLRRMRKEISSLDPTELNFSKLNVIERNNLITHLKDEWSTYITKPITKENIPTQEDLIYKPAHDVQETPIKLELINKANQDSE